MKHLSIALVFLGTMHYVAWFRRHGWNLESCIATIAIGGAVILVLYLIPHRKP